MLKEGKSQASLGGFVKGESSSHSPNPGSHISQLQKDGTRAACAQTHAHPGQKGRAEEGDRGGAREFLAPTHSSFAATPANSCLGQALSSC